VAQWVGIEELELSQRRPRRGVPPVPLSLLSQVRNHGPLEPVVVRPTGANRYEILANAETWLAVQRVGQHKVPIEVRSDINDEEAQQLLELNELGGRPNPIAEAEGFLERIDELGGRDHRGAIAQTAREQGLSRSYVSHALRLLSLPGAIRDMVAAGDLKAGHARALVGVPDRRRQLRLAERTCRDKLSVRALEALTRKQPTHRQADAREFHTPHQPSKDPDIRQLEVRISESLGCASYIDHDNGDLVIHYTGDLDVLQGVLSRLGCVS
jgi:ParB family transcriptional regulator, chromosome partitioning protein